MKVIFKTRNSMGNRNLVKRGVQLDCQVIEYGYDSPDDFKAINLILDVMRSECKDCGIYLKFLPRRRIEAEGVNDTPPPLKGNAVEAALRAKCNTALQLAESYKRMYEDLRRKILT